MKLILPIYYTYEPKKKQFKTILSGLNEVFNMHHILRNQMKIHYSMLVRGQIVPGKNKIKGKYSAHIKIFYKNTQSDAPNVVPVIDKFAIDSLQAYGILEQDNVQHYVSGSWDSEECKENPRAEIEIKEID